MSGIPCEHRKELMKFLLIKTAPVRSGVKPAEFLRVRKCYRSKPEEGFCIHQAEILATLRLPCRKLAASVLSAGSAAGDAPQPGHPGGARPDRISAGAIRKRGAGVSAEAVYGRESAA